MDEKKDKKKVTLYLENSEYVRLRRLWVNDAYWCNKSFQEYLRTVIIRGELKASGGVDA